MNDDSILVKLRLDGERLFNAGMARSSAAVSRFGYAAESAGGSLRTGIQHGSNAAAAGVAALGRAARIGALAVGTLALVGTKMGIDFNASMESNTVAFKNFLGSTKAAQRQLDYLYKTAAKTPFEFTDIVNASRKLLAYGQTAKESNKWLEVIGDTVSGIGGGTEEINRLVAAVGQIQAKGKVSTEELLQMAELGIPAFDALAKGTGRSMDDLFKDLQAGNITAKEGLKALQDQLGKTFGGSSAAQAKTFTGQLSTLKDNLRQLLGQATKPLFDYLRKTALPALNSFIKGIQKGTGTGGKFLKILKGIGHFIKDVFTGLKAGAKGQNLGLFGKTDVIGIANKIALGIRAIVKGVIWFIKEFIDAIKPAAPFLENVLWPLIKGIAQGIGGALYVAIKGTLAIIKVFARILGWIGERLKPLKGAFEVVGKVIGFVFGGPILKIIGAVGKLGGLFRFAGKLVSGFGQAAKFATGLLITFWEWIKKAAGVIAGAFSDAFKGIVGVVKGVFSSVVDFFKDRINNLIDIMNEAIKAYNAIPLAPNIGLIGHVGGGGGGAPAISGAGTGGGLFDTVRTGSGPSSDRTDAAASTARGRRTKGTPLPRSTARPWGDPQDPVLDTESVGDRDITVHSYVMLPNGRVLAEAVGDAAADRKARK